MVWERVPADRGGGVYSQKNSQKLHENRVLGSYSTIHKAAGLTISSHSMISIGTIPVEQKSVHWLSMGAAGRYDLWGAFWSAVFWEWPVTKEPAAL